MFGSKKSELTRKYDPNAFDAITFGFRSSVRVSYSTNPITANTSASPSTIPKHHFRS